MSIKDDFISNVESEVSAKSIYVWGGQGELTKTSADIAKLESMETSKDNVKRILKHLADIYPIPDNSRMFDCSGLITYHLLKLKLIKSDTTADGLFKKCKKIEKVQLRPGDLVFKVNSSGKAVHVAMYDGANYIIEAVGRDEGVKKNKLTTKFNKYGRLPFFE